MTSQAASLFDGRYRLEGELGQGGMAVVYRAQDERLNRAVAIKMLRPQFAADQNFLTRFRREAQAVAMLSHPNLAAVWDTGEVNGIPYIVMELVDGDNLKTRMAAQAPLSAERAVSLMIQICEGVGAAHRAGVVHRDLKPQNILLGRNGQIKVTDFGIARSLAGGTSTTQTGPVWGTAQYIAPEQAAGQPVSPATDVYSLGVILYEMVTGRLPFEADTALALAMQHLQAEPPPIRSYNPSVPVGLEHIITKAMAKRAQARYPDADALSSALKAYQRLGEQMTGPIPIVPRLAATPTPSAGPAPTRATASGTRGQAAPVALPQYAPPAAPLKATTDWATLVLGAVAALSVLGLIPLYWTILQRFGGG